MTIRPLALAAVAAALTLPAAARAQGTTTVPIGDECFTMKAYGAGMAEVAMSQLAVQKATSPEIKKFAEHMIRDHMMVNKQLAEVAREKQIPLPTAIDPIHATVIRRLTLLSGSDFDKEFLKVQIGAHQDAVHLFGHESHKGEDAQIKALATKTLPALHEHTKMAYEVAGEKAEHAKFEKLEKYKKQVMSEK